MKKRFFIFILFFSLLFLGVQWFNRVPQRNIPKEENTIVSPADGKVIAIIQSNDHILNFFKNGIKNTIDFDSKKDRTAIVIEMNIWNIHAQRAPIDGIITEKKYIPGKFHNAIFSKRKEYLAEENEKMIHTIHGKIDLSVIQVAGILARRIQSFKKQGDEVKKGDVIGRILLGSQVVLVLPTEKVKIFTKIGERVKDGESILAIINH